MYFDGMTFLEEERDAWRPYEGLTGLTDAQLDRSIEAARGWSGRDLIAHLVAWQEHGLVVARELAVNETSPAKVRGDEEWALRGDEMNADIARTWRELPMAEVRRRFATVPGELRGYLTVVPEARWLKDARMEQFFISETIEHYEDHLEDLRVILDGAR